MQIDNGRVNSHANHLGGNKVDFVEKHNTFGS